MMRTENVSQTTSSLPNNRVHYNEYLACVAGALILWASFGIRLCFGAFLIPVTEDTGWDRATFSVAPALFQLFWGFSQPFLVYLAERKLGFGKFIFVGSVLYGVAIIVLSAANRSAALFIFIMGIVAGGAASTNSYPVILAAVGRRFPKQSKRQSIAFGIVASFGSFGQGCFLPLARQMLSTIGWRWSLLALGGIMVVLSPLAYFLQDIPNKDALCKPEDTLNSQETHANDPSEKLATATPQGQENEAPDVKTVLKQACSSTPFLLFATVFTICGFHVGFLATHLPAYLQDNGFDASTAAWTLSVIGIGSMAGSVATGFLCTRFRPKLLMAANFLLRTIIIIIFLWVPLSLATVFIFSVVFGSLWLSTVPVTTYFIGEVFGQRYLGTLSSLTFVGHQIGAFVGAFIGGVVYDSKHDYSRMWYASLGLSILAIFASVFANDTPIYTRHAQEHRSRPSHSPEQTNI